MDRTLGWLGNLSSGETWISPSKRRSGRRCWTTAGRIRWRWPNFLTDFIRSVLESGIDHRDCARLFPITEQSPIGDHRKSPKCRRSWDNRPYMLDAPKSTVNDLSPLMLQAYRQSQDVKLFCDVESRKTSGAEVLPDEVGFVTSNRPPTESCDVAAHPEVHRLCRHPTASAWNAPRPDKP